ncbi:MAG TPA: hypothetical protein VJ978_06490 [Nitriliruptoraceae bacterium]|nr:hypothetical protein [Nitriliruptoraceae bacterium]
MNEAEHDYWLGEVRRLERGQLATVQAAADSWTKLFGAVTGIFGVAAFAGGLTTIDKLASPFNIVAASLTTLAAVCAAFSLYNSATATRSASADTMTGLTPRILRERSSAAAAEGAARLANARSWGLAAAVVIAAGSVVVLWQPLLASSESTPEQVLVVVEGRAVCGPLEGSGEDLEVAGVSLTGIESGAVTVVSRCPSGD